MREPLKWIVIYIWYHLGLNSVLHFGQTYVFDIIMTYKMTNRINTGIAIKYHGTSKWLPNQLTWQEDSIRAEISKSKEINIFFISSPPFWMYYIIIGGICKEWCCGYAAVMLWLRHSDVLLLRRKVMWCVPYSRAKRTSLPKETSRTKCTSRSAQAEHIVPKQKALRMQCFLFWRRHPESNRG